MKKLFTNYMWAVMLLLLITEALLLNLFTLTQLEISVNMYPLFMVACVLYVVVYAILAIAKIPTPKLLAKAHLILVITSFIGFYPYQTTNLALVSLAGATSIGSVGLFLGLVVLAVRRRL